MSKADNRSRTMGRLRWQERLAVAMLTFPSLSEAEDTVLEDTDDARFTRTEVLRDVTELGGLTQPEHESSQAAKAWLREAIAKSGEKGTFVLTRIVSTLSAEPVTTVKFTEEGDEE